MICKVRVKCDILKQKLSVQSVGLGLVGLGLGLWLNGTLAVNLPFQRLAVIGGGTGRGGGGLGAEPLFSPPMVLS